MGNKPSNSNLVVGDETFGENGQFKVHVKLYEGMDRDEKVKLREACRMWVAVWQSEEFKNWVLGYKFQDTALTSEEIYNELVGGLENASIVDKGADIEIWVKHACPASSLHAAFIHDGQQWKGSDYLGYYSPAKLAGHLAHEYCRSLNFLHASITAERSVPFAVGKKTKRMAEAMSYDLAESTSAKYFED
jgi:hypothetical protein